MGEFLKIQYVAGWSHQRGNDFPDFLRSGFTMQHFAFFGCLTNNPSGRIAVYLDGLSVSKSGSITIVGNQAVIYFYEVRTNGKPKRTTYDLPLFIIR